MEGARAWSRIRGRWILNPPYETHRLASAAAQRLLADIHDSLGQELVALQLHISALSRKIEAGRTLKVAELDNLSTLVERAVASLRDITRGASSVGPENGNLSAALRALAARISVGGCPEIRVDVRGSTGLVERLPSAMAVDAYRLAQEATANAIRHSAARTITISLTDLGDVLSLAVTDDGLGFDTASRRPGIGLSTMEERARWLGGVFSLRSRPNHGTTVECVWPLDGTQSGFARINGYES